jgi:hypothetical protein
VGVIKVRIFAGNSGVELNIKYGSIPINAIRGGVVFSFFFAIADAHPHAKSRRAHDWPLLPCAIGWASTYSLSCSVRITPTIFLLCNMAIPDIECPQPTRPFLKRKVSQLGFVDGTIYRQPVRKQARSFYSSIDTILSPSLQRSRSDTFLVTLRPTWRDSSYGIYIVILSQQ